MVSNVEHSIQPFAVGDGDFAPAVQTVRNFYFGAFVQNEEIGRVLIGRAFDGDGIPQYDGRCAVDRLPAVDGCEAEGQYQQQKGCRGAVESILRRTRRRESR